MYNRCRAQLNGNLKALLQQSCSYLSKIEMPCSTSNDVSGNIWAACRLSIQVAALVHHGQ